MKQRVSVQRNVVQNMATAGIGDTGSNDVKGLLRGHLARTRKLNVHLFLHVPPSPGLPLLPHSLWVVAMGLSSHSQGPSHTCSQEINSNTCFKSIHTFIPQNVNVFEEFKKCKVFQAFYFNR